MVGYSKARTMFRRGMTLPAALASAAFMLMTAGPCAAGSLTTGATCLGLPVNTGVFLDLTGKVPLSVGQIDYFAFTGVGNPVTVDIYTYDGSYTGHDDSANGWTLFTTVNTLSADGTGTTFTPLELDVPLQVDRGQTIGVCLVGRVGGLNTDCSGPSDVSNSDLRIVSDRNRCCNPDPFTGALNAGEAFVGTIHYDEHDHPYLGDRAGALHGSVIATIGDVDGDGVEDIAIGAPNHDKKRGRVLVCSGNYLHRILFVFEGEKRGDRFGFSVDGSDGKLIVGAPFHDRRRRKNAGKVYIFRYNGHVFVRSRTRTGVNRGDRFGYAVATGVDVNRSGRDDFIVGAPYYDGDHRNSGGVFVYDEQGRLLETISGERRGDLFGWSVDGVGKVDSNRSSDFIVGAPRNDEGRRNAGKAYVFSGRGFSVIHEILGSAVGGQLGRTVAGVGRVNRDDRDDFAAGAPYANGRRGSVVVHSGRNGHRLWKKNGRRPGDRFGHAIAAAGDVNNDRFGDVVVGAPFHRQRGRGSNGRVYVRSGRNGGTLETFFGTKAADRFGSSVDALGIVDDRVRHTLLAGAPRYDSGGSNRGKVFELPSRFVAVPLVGNPNLGGAVSADLNRGAGRRLPDGDLLAANPGVQEPSSDGASSSGGGATSTGTKDETRQQLDLLSFTVTDEFVNNGLLAPVAEGGVIVIDRAFRQTVFGESVFEIAGPVPVDEHDLLLIEGPARLDGTLAVVLGEGHAPQVGDSYRILFAERVIGAYAELDLPEMDGLMFVVRYEDDGVWLLVAEADAETERVSDDRTVKTDTARDLLKLFE